MQHKQSEGAVVTEGLFSNGCLVYQPVQDYLSKSELMGMDKYGLMIYYQ